MQRYVRVDGRCDVRFQGMYVEIRGLEGEENKNKNRTVQGFFRVSGMCVLWREDVLLLVGKTFSSSIMIWIEDMTVSMYCGAVI